VQLNVVRESKICSAFNLAIDYYNYGYTTLDNFTSYSSTLDTSEAFLLSSSDEFCEMYFIHYLCNYVFVPCDLTTGAPRPVCRDSCYFFRTRCPSELSYILTFARAVQYPIKDDCENTLAHIQEFGFPCSSDDFKENCIDLKGKIFYILKPMLKHIFTQINTDIA